MRNGIRALLLACAACGAARAETATYVLDIPGATELVNSSDPAENAWLAANACYVGMSVAAAETNAASVLTVLDKPRVELESVEAGFPIERAKPDYYLADEIEPPENVDWAATYEAYLADATARESFVIDETLYRLFAARGGTQRFTWVLADGTRRVMTYVISLCCSGRPRRIYWTDYPYNSPGIDLSGKFVKFFGDANILNIQRGTVTNSAAGIDQVVTNMIVRGLHLDPSTKMLFAYGMLQGQVVMAYYDSGTYDRLLHVQAVEVCRPQVNVLKGQIGRALKPDGRGYDTAGLRARPTYVSPTDKRGEYYYQHQGKYSYSPKKGNVYPLRPTTDCRWNMEIYWMETDEMEVQWPFELDQYVCDWPADTTVFVRGDAADVGRPIYVPSDYTAALMDYQEPEGHARAVASDGTFNTTGEGYSLLKLTTDDDVWFVPVHSVLRTNTGYFSLEPSDIRVGYELRLREGGAAGTAPGFSPVCDADSPGYIYQAASSPVWNPNLYAEPQPDSAGGASTNDTSLASNGDTNKYESVIYAVSANSDSRSTFPSPRLEVWWNTTIRESGMPKPLAIPTLPQVYSVRWPRGGETPQIVIASQLGSAGESVFSHNVGLTLSAEDSAAALPMRKYFDDFDGGTIMFWIKPEAGFTGEGDASVASFADSTGRTFSFDLNVSGSATNVVFAYSATGNRYSCPFGAESGGWCNVAVAFTNNMQGTGSAILYVNGRKPGVSAAWTNVSLLNWLVSYPHAGAIGASGGTAAARAGVAVGEVLTWNRALSAREIAEEMRKAHTGRESHLSACFNFMREADLAVAGNGKRPFRDMVLGTVGTACNCSIEENGPPALGTGIIEADPDGPPKVYVQNDRDRTGYNPNEEHAIVQSGAGGHVAWALRADLNTAYSSAPGVLVEYVKDGRKAMQWFDVVVTNSVYPELAGECVAGKAFPGPHPIDFFDDPWCPEDTWDEPVEVAPAFRDRKRQLWARAAGTATMRMWYRMQAGFAFPALDRANWPVVGAAVPWLSLLGDNPASVTVLADPPAKWTWRVVWPENVPEIEIGRTLTVAASGLPEVWNAASVGVVWPATDAERDRTAVLFDPTVARTAGFSSSVYADVATMIADMGIKQGAGGNATLRKGRWTFNDLPPSISKRFYIDTTESIDRCLKLVGEMEDNSAGVSLLYVNVLNAEERSALAAAVAGTASKAGKTRWEEAIRGLARECEKPSPHATVSTREDRIDYKPRDHYALFTMGATNYVTLIENDSTNELMGVSAGDPISMHLVKVVPKYFTGRVVTREDPLNLLSQQLSIIYAEAFAGQPEDYIFEWRKCRPSADGTVPTDFDGRYEQKFSPTNGLTRFVIGGQGDTLANMVNTYYAMRYRAASTDSPAYAAMGYEWSEWTDPPALAEGWVQRVLNNVTPFAQRMRDLVENPAETAVSMVRQAGKPYEGDVALNQDNLASVGLIQLYETLLSKAESMSLQVGIDDADANKQLQLAVCRLADLYNVLGDEAWTDALNPTIGFGSNFDTTSMTGFELDYGALSSTLFAFDNQVPTLLDEELALLRGRSGDNAPSTHISPYYNRLVWNFTKGITAGEVAYAVNYDISGNDKGVVDENDAADMYPQGHGDAYGHYLSALSGYYRLLRNPYFSWGPPAMGEMTVADAVLNVDYYDEAQFAKAAYNVAKVAAETVDRTARKAYRDNGGATGAGYLDTDPTRNFGYGEWASRGGFGAFCNWAVANALLEESPDGGRYFRYKFSGGEWDVIWMELEDGEGPSLRTNGAWTVEFQLVPDEGTGGENVVPVAMGDNSHAFAVFLEAGGKLSVARQDMLLTTATNNVTYWLYTNVNEVATKDTPYSEIEIADGRTVLVCGFFGGGAPTGFPDGFELTAAALDNPPDWEGWCRIDTYVDEEANGAVVSARYDFEDVETDYKPIGDEVRTEIGTVPAGANTLVSLTCAAGGTPVARLIDASGAILAEKDLGFTIALRADWAEIGYCYAGEIGEVRVWEDVARTTDELSAKREYVSPKADGLKLYLRTISETKANTLADETDGSIQWGVAGGEWIEAAASGVAIAFADEGLKRIDRSTVPEIVSLANMIPAIQKKVDQMDAGLNPLGLSESAIPFDITPIGEGDDAKTHYEQIRERAGTALANAKKSLDKAQFSASRLRLLQESHVAHDSLLDTMELEMKNQLIEYFGYPYAGDIGPGGTYAQGYDGPDLVNYMWMEPETCGLSANEDIKSITTNVYKYAVKDYIGGAGSGVVQMYNFYNTTGELNLVYERTASGIIVKPAKITGKRRAQGHIQDALGELLAAYANYKSALTAWDVAMKQFDYENKTIWSKLARDHVLEVARKAQLIYESVQNWTSTADKILVNTLETAAKLSGVASDAVIMSVPKVMGAGMTVNTDPQAIANAAQASPRLSAQIAINNSLVIAKNDLVKNDGWSTFLEIGVEMLEAANDSVDNYDGYYQRMVDAADKVNDAVGEVRSAFVELQTAQCAVETVIAEAERVIDTRTLVRQQATDTLTKARYNDMFFRLQQNNALSRYSAQFDLAQRYVFLAAQAYDYETGLLSSDAKSGEKFMARVVGVRTLGEFDDDGAPIVCSDGAKGDGGLAAILAEMDANWLVLKPRLGINNPQQYATWFSLRHDLFRIFAGEDGDRAWRTELRKYIVDDLNSLPTFRHYCQPFAGSTAAKEPGLVIPFPSLIAHGYNFFGNELAGGDSALDSTYFATHIASAGVHFEGYDDGELAKTPTAYLVPVGEDRMRAVGDPDTVVSWKVVDQTIPAPFAIGSTQLDDPDWTPLYDGNTGGNDFGARIRKHPSFRAYYDDDGKDPSDDSLDCTRLVGRSAWNTKWLLIIPAGSLGADREAALSAFINGIDSDRDGQLDFAGVKDIKLGLKTYSTSGN